ncbi:MAG: NAD(+) synthase [Clostridia bacterium]|nr:NAD(+) synthase [Clostridia bacterium]
MANLAQRIKELKDIRRLTSAELSTLSGVPLGTLNKVLSSSTKSVKTETLKKIADALSVSVAYLLGEKEKPLYKAIENYGFVKVAAVTPKLYLGDVDKNVQAIQEEIIKLSAKRVKLAVFPELSICGYTLGDLMIFDLVLDKSEKALKEIADFSKNYDLLIFVGAPVRKDGKLYNCAVAIFGGEILGVVPKTRLPSYDEFDEKRTFTPAPDDNSTIKICGKEYPFGTKILFECKDMPDFKVGVDICEDMWFVHSPSEHHALNGATIIANLSASDELVGKAERRRKIVSIQSYKECSAYIYSNTGMGESSTDLLYSGHNIIAENGQVLAETELFSENYAIADVDVYNLQFVRRKKFNYKEECTGGYQTVKFSAFVSAGVLDRKYDKNPFIPNRESERIEAMETALLIQSYALIRRLKQVRSNKVVIGLSGGLDSTLAILATSRAFDRQLWSKKDIIAVTMPCFGTTERTKGNAEKLAEILGVTLKTVDISKAVTQHFIDIGHDEKVADVTFENSQARERTQVLMDIANKENAIVIGTGDLSEMALGWATYNGDHMSMYNLNSSIPKTMVRALVAHVAENEDGELSNVLYDILDTPVSPELLPSNSDDIVQKTEDIVGPYELHDFFMYHFIVDGFSPSKIYKIAVKTFEDDYDEKTVYKWIENFFSRFFVQQFKRSCAPDGVKVSAISFSPRGNWHMPSDMERKAWLDDLKNVNQNN